MMDQSSFQVHVPGKLMIAGEYAVLERDQKAIVLAVDRYVTLSVSHSDDYRLSFPGMGYHVTWAIHENTVRFSRYDVWLQYIKQAILTVKQYNDDFYVNKGPFTLTIESDLEGDKGRKFGLGSSAAVVVGVVTALLYLNEGEMPSREKIFKLAAIAHFRSQKSGSGADVAASAFGGWLVYRSFHPGWMRSLLMDDMPVETIVHKRWPHYSAERFTLPSDLVLCTGWTGQPASTATFINDVKQIRKQYPDVYDRFLTNTERAVNMFLRGAQTGECRLVIDAVKENRRALTTLDERAHTPIETLRLSALAHLAESHGGAGKPSGAGGGDCGIAFIGSRQVNKLRAAWRARGIEPLHLHENTTGVTIAAE